MKKLLIIGSNGFIGSSCAVYFRDNYDVFLADIHPGVNTPIKYRQIKSDVDFLKILSEKEFDFCINASGSANVSFSFDFPEVDRKLNVENVKLILDAISETNNKCKFINFSSASVYGQPDQLPVSEVQTPAPISPYANHKLESELILKEYAEKTGIHTCSLRVFSAYGPVLRKQLFWDIFQQAKNSKLIRLFGTGKESRDFIYIDDLLQAVDCVMNNSSFNGESINVSSGKETSIAEAAEIFLSELGTGYSVHFNGKSRPGDPLNWRADITKLTQHGFKQTVDIRQGLSYTAKAYLSLLK